ncbi:protein-glutamate methylesterase [Reticulibacter mediterranei]|uniref:protein-glutamate methylesterase n=1 Tax=Reticulibacter mediterranei TaxID=2778369 RepID=A0A8J3ISC2_9CHLR|nr:chemotaxis protein CheB [Reticulibacter mediterranei]GHO97625.1 protein-glutamate methylesterase [Reticulibacter mediterranei]
MNKESHMTGHDMIALGASAGGVEALIAILRTLPKDLPAALFVVLHIPAQSPSLLPDILNRICPLIVLQPEDGVKIAYGHVYVAPPDHHLLIERGSLCVTRGPKENRHRPAIDPLFRSLAYSYGPRGTGVVLTGALDDGTSGLLAIKQRGGIAVVQDPDEALYPSMPLSAIEHVPVDYRLPLAEIGPLLTRLAHEPVQTLQLSPPPEDLQREIRIAAMETNALNEHEQIGKPSVYSCPECGGVLWETQDGNLLHFRCRTGHAFSPESVLAEQSEQLEHALWAALKTLEEKVSLMRRLALQAQENERSWLAQRYEMQWRDAEEHAILLRRILMQGTREPFALVDEGGDEVDPETPS